MQANLCHKARLSKDAADEPIALGNGFPDHYCESSLTDATHFGHSLKMGRAGGAAD